MPESLGLPCPLVPEWNLRKVHCDAQGVDLGLGGQNWESWSQSDLSKVSPGQATSLRGF